MNRAGLTVLTVTIAALTASPASAGWEPAEGYHSPVEPMRVVRLADLPSQPWLPGHRGVDLEARVGDPVHAPASGIVTFAGTVVDRDVVSVQHRDGAISSMEPVDAMVETGQSVARGERLGTVQDLGAGHGHCRPDSCLHWGVRVDGEYIDPLDVLVGFGTVRLLPRSESVLQPRRSGSRTPRPSASATAWRTVHGGRWRRTGVRRMRPCP